jgi:hypothetical protein
VVANELVVNSGGSTESGNGTGEVSPAQRDPSPSNRRTSCMSSGLALAAA